MPWREVQRISLEVLALRYWGVIPIGRTETLCIARDGGAFGTRRLRVSAAAIALPAGGGAGLVHLLQQAHLEAISEAGVVMAGAGNRGWGAGTTPEPEEEFSTEFDPDAAVARYLASKQAAQPAPIERPKTMNRPAMPQRPVFGRRVS